MSTQKDGCVIIRQEGFYYGVNGNDALILHKCLGYKLYGIKNYRTGFPVNGAETVLNKFDKFCIDYDLYSQQGELLASKRFPVNNYETIDPELYPLPINSESKDKTKPKAPKLQSYMQVLQALNDEVNPYTGEMISGLDNEFKADILDILLYFENRVKQREQLRESCANTGKSWTDEEDGKLLEEYNGHLSIKEMAKLHQRTNGAIKTRLLQLINLPNEEPDTTETVAEDDVEEIPAETAQANESLPSATKSCKNCMEMKNGNCFGQDEICEDFRFAPTISAKERANWPQYGDVTALKKGERR